MKIQFSTLVVSVLCLMCVVIDVVAFTLHTQINPSSVSFDLIKLVIHNQNGSRINTCMIISCLRSKNSSFDDEIINNNEGTDDEEEQIETPRYRSKLQRLNQVQNKEKFKSNKKTKTTLKNRTRTSMEQINESSNSSPMPSGLLGDLTIDEDYGIESFLRGEYDRPFADDAAAPLPKHQPSEIIEIALNALHDLDVPTTDHGAAVFMRFCAPLSRQDRWGNTTGMISSWKAIMRGSLTPTMLARRLRASEEYSVLLDWEQLDVTEGTKAIPNDMLGYDSTVAFVNAALFFGNGIEPAICQFTLKMFNGVWLIDSAVMNKRELFMDSNSST